MLSNIIAGSIFALSVGKALAGVQFGGVNIAGFGFGGTCILADTDPPLTQYGGCDGAGQMQHFTENDGLNIYRLPMAWQYLTNNVASGPLDPINFPKYDALVQACLSTSSHCIIDIHNYAGWDGNIIGQSAAGPSNAEFADLWQALATHYAADTSVIFGIMNEPHDSIDSTTNSIPHRRGSHTYGGATSQYILLPGNDYTSAQTFVSDGSAAALINVTNLDGSTTNLIFDVHQYLDSDGSGIHTDCVSDHVADTFTPLATYLARISNSDEYLGYLGWAAGSFSATTYILSLTPSGSAAAGWVDQPLLTQCFQKESTGGSSSAQPTTTQVPSSSSPAVAPPSSCGASSASAESTTPVPSASSTGAAGSASPYSASPASSASSPSSTSAAAISPSSISTPAGYASDSSTSSTAVPVSLSSASSSTVISYSSSSAPSGYGNAFSIGTSGSYGSAASYGSAPTTFSTRTSSTNSASGSPSSAASSGGNNSESECNADY
ncbi:hypothetical protein MMC08_003493 [Hypocenomyce scalaris]|nr:hypothetical protein [Hypocenomyce scalaris]